MENYIYQVDNSLPTELCDQIIEQFNSKNISSLKLPFSPNHVFIDEWKYCKAKLAEILNQHISIYTSLINFDQKKGPELLETYIHFHVENIVKRNFFIKKYTIYDNDRALFEYDDFYIDPFFENKLTFILFLNDGFENGETVFINDIIQPKKGKLIIFPVSWTFPYKENMIVNLKDIKYIIKGNLIESRIYSK
jgi:hypothetical protein